MRDPRYSIPRQTLWVNKKKTTVHGTQFNQPPQPSQIDEDESDSLFNGKEIVSFFPHIMLSLCPNSDVSQESDTSIDEQHETSLNSMDAEDCLSDANNTRSTSLVSIPSSATNYIPNTTADTSTTTSGMYIILRDCTVVCIN